MAQQISLVHAMHVDTMPAVTGTGICPPGQDVIDDVEAITAPTGPLPTCTFSPR